MALHANMDHEIPEEALARLGMWQCLACKCLLPLKKKCACNIRPQTEAQGGEEGEEMETDQTGTDESAPNPGGREGTGGASLNGEMPGNMCPPLSEVLSLGVATVRHIPSRLERRVGHCLGKCLKRLVEEETWEALSDWVSFPKLILRAPQRGGKGHRKQAELAMEKRLDQWEAGIRKDLWDETLTSVSKPKGNGPETRAQDEEDNDTLPKKTIEIIRGLVEEGALSKAAKHLVSRGVADIRKDPANAAKLQALHPRAGNPHHENLGIPRSHAVAFSEKGDDFSWGILTRKAIFSFPPGSAPGPSGLRPGHIKACVKREGTDSELEAAITQMAKKAAYGYLPLGLAPVLCASSLIPLNKKDEGIRPIAVGDTLRRTIGKILLNNPVIRKEVQSLQPRQCGVGVSSACELVGMTMQGMVNNLDPQGDWVVLQVDVKNAFNTLSRDAILVGCHEKCPSLFNWINFCYRQESPLVCQGQWLCTSQKGAHQGDSCGPSGFALGLDQA